MPPSMPLIVDVSALQDMMQRGNSFLMAHQTKEEHRRGVLEVARRRLSLGARGAEPGTYTPTTAERRRANLGAAASSAGPGTAEWLWSLADARPPAKPGESFKNIFNVTDEVLGHGLNGQVKLAVHVATGKKVALKVYHRDQMGRQEVTDLVREVTTQSSLRHPNVAKVEAIYQSANHIRLLVEHLSGGSVFDHIVEEAALSEEHALSVVRQLLSAVEQVHAQGLVHRDIKLENMMYTGADRQAVKLIDFGFCTSWKAGDAPMTRRCGTEGYMAPELVRKHGYTSVADMWSVGVVAHALLTGDLPGRHEDWTPIMSARLAECSLEAQKFVAALLTVDPADRLTAQQALTHCFMLRQERRPARFDSFCSTAAGTEIEGFSSDSESDLDCTSPKPFSCLYPSETSTPKCEKKSIWQALPTFGFGASRKVGAVLAAVRNCRSKASRVSFEADL
mmetsp:Transcript_43916/g.95947  ORF Transcript_43916/g.95947 Transcript_43916/m.95947 type:complete len:450 (+) Transcript_43916:83-1432(+)